MEVSRGSTEKSVSVGSPPTSARGEVRDEAERFMSEFSAASKTSHVEVAPAVRSIMPGTATAERGLPAASQGV